MSPSTRRAALYARVSTLDQEPENQLAELRRYVAARDVQATIAAQQTQQLEAVEVRIEDVLRDLKAIAHTDPHVLSEQSGVPARWADKLKALELLMKHLGLAQSVRVSSAAPSDPM